MSLISTSRSAWTFTATIAPRVSLSPTAISAVATVSFSLMTGRAPSSSSRDMVLWKFSLRWGSSTSDPVRRICATVWWYSENSLSYIYISSHWPTAARACLVGMSEGFFARFSFPTPMAMAPEDTSTSSCPAFFRSLMTLHSRSTRRIFSFPVAWVRVEVPNLTTIRIWFTPLV